MDVEQDKLDAARRFGATHAINASTDDPVEAIRGLTGGAGVDYAVERLAGKVRLTNGLLRLTPMRMTYQGGATDLELTLAARKTPEFSVRIEAQNQVLDELLGRLRPELRATGKLDLQANLKSVGDSLEEVLSAVSGDISVNAEKVDLPRQYLQYFSVVGPPSRAAGNTYTSVEIDGAASARIGLPW